MKPANATYVIAAVIAAAPLWAEDWSASEYSKIESQTLSTSSLGPGDHNLHLPLTAIVARGSNWTTARVERQLHKTAGTLDGCGISLGPVEVIRARFPTGRKDVDMSAEETVPDEVERLSSALPREAERPTAFFVGRLDGDPAVARSFRRAPGVSKAQAATAPYLNTVWVAYRAHWIERSDESYSPVAHELGHLLCECGHTGGEQSHLLHDKRNLLSAEALPEHCSKFRQSSLIQYVTTQ